MCTALILHRAHPAASLVLAANRDELLSRPSTAPLLLREDWPRAIGGRDLLHGGTWLGANQAGLVVLVTNMRSQAEERRSRGELALQALGLSTLSEIDALVSRQARAAAYRPFNLIYGDGAALHVAHVRDQGVEVLDVPPGLHVLPSGGRLDEPGLPKVGRARLLLEAAAGAGNLDDLRTALLRALGDHWQPTPAELPPHLRSSDLGPELEARAQALCVHTPTYGTRSVAFVALGPQGLHYEFSAGPACEARLETVDGLLAQRPSQR